MSKFGVLGPRFFLKTPQNFQKVSEFFQNRKETIIFVSKLVQNHHIDHNLVKFSPNTPKKSDFPLKTVILSFRQG